MEQFICQKIINYEILWVAYKSCLKKKKNHIYFHFLTQSKILKYIKSILNKGDHNKGKILKILDVVEYTDYNFR